MPLAGSATAQQAGSHRHETAKGKDDNLQPTTVNPGHLLGSGG